MIAANILQLLFVSHSIPQFRMSRCLSNLELSAMFSSSKGFWQSFPVLKDYSIFANFWSHWRPYSYSAPFLRHKLFDIWIQFQLTVVWEIWIRLMRGLPFAENFKFVAFFSQLESVKQEQSLLMVQSPHLTLPLNHMFSESPTLHRTYLYLPNNCELKLDPYVKKLVSRKGSEKRCMSMVSNDTKSWQKML